MTDTERVPLATCSYSEFSPEMGVPVRFTAGAPRWPLRYTLAGHARLITPTYAMLKMERGEYRAAYEDRLSQTGTLRIAAELKQYAVPGRALVLLCFEKLADPAKWCHRGMFAHWWEYQTGEEVPELGAVAPKPPPTLF